MREQGDGEDGDGDEDDVAVVDGRQNKTRQE
jgi:hypothetical protein